MIDQSTIDRVIAVAKIEEVVGDYVTLKKRGVNLIGLCPFHNEKTPSFTVSPAKNICKCFGCGKGGNPVNFLMELEQLSFSDAIKQLAKKYNIEVVEKELTPEQLAVRNDRDSMFVVNEYAQKYFSNILHNHIDGTSIGLSYFRERGFNDDTIRKFGLGYSLDARDAFTQEALKKGYQKEYLIKTGLTLEYEDGRLTDRFRGRVMFPVHSLSGKVVAFGGRILKKDDKMAKYVNSPESEVYHKSNELYGIFFAKQEIVRQDRCYLVEGYTDVISMHQAGIENVVASSGTSLTHGQIRLIHRFTPNITVIYDGDSAGIKASLRGIDMLLEEGMNIKVLLLPEGEDPDSFARSQNASDFIAFVEKNSVDFIRFKTSLLLEDAGNDPIKRAALISDIVRSIAVIPDNIIRSVYIKDCSRLMNIEENVLYSEINKIKRIKFDKELERQENTKHLPQQATEKTETPAIKTIVSPYEEQEKNLLYYIVRYGERALYQDENGKNISITEFIISELDTDAIVFQNPLYALVLLEAKQLTAKENIGFENYFLNHQNQAISLLTTDFVTEKYTLCKSQAEQLEKETDRLHELIPRVIFELKNKILLDRIKEKINEMKKAHEEQNTVRENELLTEISQLNQVKSQLAKTLGERIIIRL